MSDELPKSWASTPFMDVFDIQGGTQPPKSTFKYEPTKGYVRLLQIRDFGEKPVPTFIQSKPTLKTCQKDDILIGRYGASIGRICTGMEGAYNVALAKVIIPEQIDRRFVFHVLRSPFFQRPILDIERSAQDGFNKEDLAEIILPLAPLAEQRRIVAKLEKLLGQVDACQERLQKMPTLLKRFRQSILAAACSGRLTADWREENPNVKPASEVLSQISKEREKVKLRKAKKISDGDEIEFPFDIPKTWALCFFDDLAAAKPNAIKAGPFGSSLTKACYVPKGFKVYGQEQVINGDPNFGDYYISAEKFRELQSCEVSAGDILVSLVGTIGKVLVIPEKFQPGIINPRLAKFSLHPTIVREYIANYLLSTLAKNMMSQQSHGGTMEILNLGIMRKLPIPLAPLAEQQEIVRRVAGLFELADQLEQRLAIARRQVDKLTPSLLARAFAGKLVPQDPADEPAEKLLERIKSTQPKPS